MFGPSHLSAFGNAFDQTKIDKLDPMQNQLCRVCEEPAAGFHFGAFTCEGCKSFFGRTCNNQSVIQECKNNYRCVINKKNRTTCKACRLRKCLMMGMSKSGSRYGRRSNWFKIHCLMQQVNGITPSQSPSSLNSLTPRASQSDQTSSNDLSPILTSSTTAGLWRPIEVASSPRSSHSDQGGTSTDNRLFRSPSHSPANVLDRDQAFSQMVHHQRFRNVAANRETDAPKHLSPEIPISASLAMASRFPSLYSPFSGSLPFLPPTFNFPALAALPIHKQALLSPLLASSHMLAAAAARKAYPFLSSSMSSYDNVTKSHEDVFAEHKAFLERFRSTICANRSASVSGDDERRSTSSPIALSPSPTPSVATAGTAARTIPSSSTSTTNIRVFGPINPIDLTKQCSSDEHSDVGSRSRRSSSSSSMGSEIIPNLSDTDPEEIVEAACLVSKRPEEVPLDLTCA